MSPRAYEQALAAVREVIAWHGIAADKEYMIEYLLDTLESPDIEDDRLQCLRALIGEICPSIEGTVDELAAAEELLRVKESRASPVTTREAPSNWTLFPEATIIVDTEAQDAINAAKDKEFEEEFLRYFGDGTASQKKQILDKYEHEFYDTCEIAADGSIISGLADSGVPSSQITRKKGKKPGTASEVLSSCSSTSGSNRMASLALLQAQRERNKAEAEKEKLRQKQQKLNEAKKKEETARRVIKRERRTGH